MVFEPDYESILEQAAKKIALNVETYSGDRRDQSVSSGLLCTDLILGNGGWVSGWHTSLGFEQSAKTTTLIHTMHEVLNKKIKVKQLWDYEKSFSKPYALGFTNNYSMDGNTFGVKDGKGSWKIKPEFWSFDEHTAEPFFDTVHMILKEMPRKRKIGDTWFYIYDTNTKTKKIVGEKYSKTLYRSMGKYCIEAEDGTPQIFIGCDSYPAMLPENMDDDSSNNAMASQARMFSEQIKRIKGLLGSRNGILLGINQMRLRPAVRFGNPEYEPCGEALKLNSDIRLLHKTCAPPPAYTKTGNRDGQSLIENSIKGKNLTDSYRFITVDVIKNKLGGAIRGTRIHHRIWESDGVGEAHGIDPVFDTWQYLKFTKQLSGDIKKFTLDIKGNPLHKSIMTFDQLKHLVCGTPKQKKDICKNFKIKKNPKIREWCFNQLQSGKGYDLFKGADSEIVE